MLLITITATSFNTIENPDTLILKCTELKLEECACKRSADELADDLDLMTRQHIEKRCK